MFGKSWCGLQLRLIVPGQWKAAWTCELEPAEEVTSLAATVLRNIHTGEQAALELWQLQPGLSPTCAASWSQTMQQKSGSHPLRWYSSLALALASPGTIRAPPSTLDGASAALNENLPPLIDAGNIWLW